VPDHLARSEEQHRDLEEIATLQIGVIPDVHLVEAQIERRCHSLGYFTKRIAQTAVRLPDEHEVSQRLAGVG